MIVPFKTFSGWGWTDSTTYIIFRPYISLGWDPKAPAKDVLKGARKTHKLLKRHGALTSIICVVALSISFKITTFATHSTQEPMMENLQILHPTAFMIDMGEMRVGTFISSRIERTKPFLWKWLEWKRLWCHPPVTTNELSMYGLFYIYLHGWRLLLKTPTEVFLAWRFETSRWVGRNQEQPESFLGALPTRRRRRWRRRATTTAWMHHPLFPPWGWGAWTGETSHPGHKLPAPHELGKHWQREFK